MKKRVKRAVDRSLSDYKAENPKQKKMAYWSIGILDWRSSILPLLHYSTTPILLFYAPYSFLANSANLNFCTFPERVMGNALTNLK